MNRAGIGALFVTWIAPLALVACATPNAHYFSIPPDPRPIVERLVDAIHREGLKIAWVDGKARAVQTHWIYLGAHKSLASSDVDARHCVARYRVSQTGASSDVEIEVLMEVIECVDYQDAFGIAADAPHASVFSSCVKRHALPELAESAREAFVQRLRKRLNPLGLPP